ncbi:hypothetical protein [Marinococcus halophilus]|nr:hypothetical protein [Marinococcus halophilus]
MKRKRKRSEKTIEIQPKNSYDKDVHKAVTFKHRGSGPVGGFK